MSIRVKPKSELYKLDPTSASIYMDGNLEKYLNMMNLYIDDNKIFIDYSANRATY